MNSLNSVVARPTGFDSLANFVGQSDFPDFDVLVCQNRDSDCLTRSNFRLALKALGGESDDVQVFRFGHWACGWWEALAVKRGTSAHAIAEDIERGLLDYPVVDDCDFSALESEEADETWRNCYRWRDRIKYIRKFKNQFEFQSFADMLGCVRGNYFAGYASELLA